jgi:hypothetical protein
MYRLEATVLVDLTAMVQMFCRLVVENLLSVVVDGLLFAVP